MAGRSSKPILNKLTKIGMKYDKSCGTQNAFAQWYTELTKLLLPRPIAGVIALWRVLIASYLRTIKFRIADCKL